MNQKSQIKQIYDKLLNEFGYRGWWPVTPTGCQKKDNELPIPIYGIKNKTPKQKFEIALGAILTQNTNWHPNAVLALVQLNLGRELSKEEKESIKKKDKNQIKTKKENSSLISPKEILKEKTERIAQLIRPSGYYNQKSLRLKTLSEFFLKKQNPSRKELLKLNGIGPETADSILLYAFNKPEFVIDAYTKRLYKRYFGIKTELSYDEQKEIFEKNLEKDEEIYNEYHALIVELAKKNCKSKNPLCESCPLKNECSFKSPNSNL